MHTFLAPIIGAFFQGQTVSNPVLAKWLGFACTVISLAIITLLDTGVVSSQPNTGLVNVLLAAASVLQIVASKTLGIPVATIKP